MPVIAIISRKGGSGKSTLATHVAAWLSLQGEPTMLGDVDRQQSSVHWLRRREQQRCAGTPLVGWAMDPQRVLRPPHGVRHVVLDTPGGLHGFELSRVLGYADLVLLPVAEGLFDRESARDCLAELMAHPRVASGRTRVGVVAVRMESGARGSQRMRQWAQELGVALVGLLPASRVYPRSAELGLTLFDWPADRIQPALAHWAPILRWVREGLQLRQGIELAAEARAGAAAPGRNSAPPLANRVERPVDLWRARSTQLPEADSTQLPTGLPTHLPMDTGFGPSVPGAVAQRAPTARHAAAHRAAAARGADEPTGWFGWLGGWLRGGRPGTGPRAGA